MNRLRTKSRNISGILLLDKRIGVSSNAALQEVKRLFQAGKAGHTGSLDPLASGLLLVCMGEATKVSSFLLNDNKRYLVTVRLGVATSTGDSEGEIIKQQKVPVLTENQVLKVLSDFVGSIDQVPPMYSALKHNGVRLYELARRGIEVERKSRRVSIFELGLKRYNIDSLELEVHCSKGTYIRSLAEDIGIALGCCGYVEQLRRTEVGHFSIKDAWRLDALQDLAEGAELSRSLVSIDEALVSWAEVQLSDELAYYVRQGQAVFAKHAPAQGWVKLYTKDSGFFGIGQIKEDGKVAPRRLLNLNVR